MEFEQKQSIFLQIAHHVCEQILQGVWKNDDKIPSVREMAIALQVNPNTVVRSYGLLEEHQIIIKQRGIGYFVAPNGIDKALQLKKENFFQKELPSLLKTLKLLSISTDELINFCKENYCEKNK